MTNLPALADAAVRFIETSAPDVEVIAIHAASPEQADTVFALVCVRLGVGVTPYRVIVCPRREFYVDCDEVSPPDTVRNRFELFGGGVSARGVRIWLSK